MASSQADAWSDHFSRFKDACAELGDGEMVHTTTFSLQDSIAALELMDPKMDSGMASNNVDRIDSFAAAIERGLPLDAVEPGVLVGIMDDVLASIISWLQGNSLAQTVFTCLYLHDPGSVEDPVLKAYCYASLKLVDEAIDTVVRADIYEEEDFSSSKSGFGLTQALSLGDADALITAACSHIDGLQLADDFNVALKARLQLMLDLLNVMDSTTNPAGTQRSQKLVEKLQGHCRVAKETMHLGSSRITERTTAKPFEPFVNSHLLAPTPPREIGSLARGKAYIILGAELSNLGAACAVTSCGSLIALLDFFLMFNRRSPGLLARAKLYLMLGSRDKLLGRVPVVHLVADAVRDFDAVDAGVSKAISNDDPELKPVLANYYTQFGNTFCDVFKVLCNNRARQRRKLGKMMSKMQSLVAQAYDVSSAVGAVWFCRGIDDARTLDLQIFTNRFSVEFCIRYLLLGFELKLYAKHEFRMIWFYLDYLLGWIITTMTDATARHQEQLASQAQAQPAGKQPTGKKNKNKKKKANKAKKQNHILEQQASAAKYFQALRFFCKGLQYVHSAAEKAGRLEKVEFQFTSQRILFRKRFAPFEQLDYPPTVSYDSYVGQTNVSAEHITPAHLFNYSAKQFMQATQTLAELLESTTAPSPGTKEEWEKLQKVAKTNMVACRLAIMQGSETEIIHFDFAEHVEFPILRLRPPAKT